MSAKYENNAPFKIPAMIIQQSTKLYKKRLNSCFRHNEQQTMENKIEFNPL